MVDRTNLPANISDMPNTKSIRLLCNVALIIFSIVWITFTSIRDSKTTDIKNVQPQKGFLAPEFSLKSLAGGTIKLSDMHGKPILVNIWASWCTPCQAEMPAIQKMFDRYGSKIAILAVNSTTQDSLADVTAFVTNNQLTFPVLLDKDGAVTKSYQVQALPTTFFINANGIIQEVIIGGPMSETLLEIRIQQLLGEQ